MKIKIEIEVENKYHEDDKNIVLSELKEQIEYTFSESTGYEIQNIDVFEDI